MLRVNQILTKSILTPTGGFLSAFTHTLNPYVGCQLGNSFCGKYCYANAIALGIRKDAREWGSYVDVKINGDENYEKEYVDIKKKDRPLRIFMSSVTDPYLPIEKEFKVTRKILKTMIKMPPDSLVIQTHTPNVLRDLALLIELNKKCKLSIQITAESDKENDELQYYQTKERLRHMYSIESRLNALKRIKEAGLFSVGVVSPLMPLNDPSQFASKLDKTSNFVILDHYLLGDGSGGFRTKSRNYFSEPLPSILLNNNQDEWNSLDKFNEIVAVFRKVLGPNKLGISKEGFAKAPGISKIDDEISKQSTASF